MKKKLIINKFLKDYCNYDGLRSVTFTFDIDWAPEFMIEDLLNLTSSLNVTLFNTHSSKILKNISNENITIGVHPNTQNKSSHGKNLIEIKNSVKKFGNLKYCRFHVLGHSYPDLKYFSKNGTRVDSSILLVNQSHLKPSYHPDIDLTRLPYIWEDGMTLNFGGKIQDSFKINLPGMKILNFHPLDVYLNTSSIKQRNNFKNKYKSVLDAEKKDTIKYINKKNYGIRNFLQDLISYSKRKRVHFASIEEVDYEFRKKK